MDQDSALKSVVDRLRLQHTGSSTIADSPTELFGAEAKQIIGANKQQAKEAVNQAYSIADFNAKASTINYKIPTGTEATGIIGPDGQPITRQLFKDISIEGPIMYPKAAKFMILSLKLIVSTIRFLRTVLPVLNLINSNILWISFRLA